LITFQITKGHYGEVLLDGVRFAQIVAWPGPIHEGNGTRQMIIDENATPQQRQALLEISSGTAGGTYFEIFSAVCPTTLDPLVAPISLQVDREKRTATVRIDNIADGLVEPIKNPVTGEEHRVRIDLPFGFEYKQAEIGNTVRFTVSSSSKLRMEHQNTYAQLNAFDWSNL